MLVATVSATKALGEAVSAESALLGEPAVVTTVATTLPLAPPRVATMLRLCAMLLRRVVAYVPAVVVLPPAAANVSPPPRLLKATGATGTALPKASSTLTTTLAACTLSATNVFGDASNEERAAFGEPAVPMRVVVTATDATCAVMVFVSAFVARNVVA